MAESPAMHAVIRRVVWSAPSCVAAYRTLRAALTQTGTHTHSTEQTRHASPRRYPTATAIFAHVAMNEANWLQLNVRYVPVPTSISEIDCAPGSTAYRSTV